MTIIKLAAYLRHINKGVALVVGFSILATSIYIISEVILRKLGMSLGGSDEISGYVMAGVASWGMAYGLTEMAHVRIDVIRLRVKPFWRSCLDVFSILILTVAVSFVAIQAWPVLAKTIASNSRANTPLETPLWIPQLVWFSGWLWFAVSAAILTLLAAICLARGQLNSVSEIAGIGSESCEHEEPAR